MKHRAPAIRKLFSCFDLSHSPIVIWHSSTKLLQMFQSEPSRSPQKIVGLTIDQFAIEMNRCGEQWILRSDDECLANQFRQTAFDLDAIVHQSDVGTIVGKDDGQ